jgi:hypothetical protein
MLCEVFMPRTRLLIFLVSNAATALGVLAADSVSNHPFPGISWRAEAGQEPPSRWFIAEVELTNPAVQIRVSAAGPDPDGPGPWQTTLLQPTRIAAREGFDLVVNGDFFRARGLKDAEGPNSTYRPEVWGAVVGPAVTDGKAWSSSVSNVPCLVVHRDRHVTIEMLSQPTEDEWEVVAGNTLLVSNGVAVPHQNKLRHPRTAIGLDDKATRLTILVVDGRKPGIAVGMNYAELAEEMLRLGCHTALNLDGGGSSVMAIRDAATEEYQILNAPTDGHERAVANVLGISAHEALKPKH